MHSKQTVVVAGASGLIGSLLVAMLLNDEAVAEVRILVRKKSGNSHPRLREMEIDFSKQELLNEVVKADAVFCCLGTTIRVAGSQEAFEKVDLHYPVYVAKAAAANGVPSFFMVSSLGADKSSSNFYLKTKGRCEEAVSAAGIPSVYLFRPSMLLGKRKEFRFGELMGKFFMQLFFFVFIGKLKRYRAVKASSVAASMLHFFHQQKPGIHVVENNEILRYRG